MKAVVLDLNGSPVEEVELPLVFSVPFRPDVIHRVFTIWQSRSKQPQGRDIMAGKRMSAESWGVGRGVARVARYKARGTGRAGQGAMVAGTVGGRRAHPPRVEKRIKKDVNRKERALAIASAVAATARRELVVKRGHRVTEAVPIPLVVVDDLEEVKRTKELVSVLKALGLDEELERLERKKIRRGKSRWRGRPTKRPKGPLIVFREDRGITKAANNIPGVEAVPVDQVSVPHLAPGGHPGRLTIWTKSALKAINERLAKYVKYVRGVVAAA